MVKLIDKDYTMNNKEMQSILKGSIIKYISLIG